MIFLALSLPRVRNTISEPLLPSNSFLFPKPVFPKLKISFASLLLCCLNELRQAFRGEGGVRLFHQNPACMHFRPSRRHFRARAILNPPSPVPGDSRNHGRVGGGHGFAVAVFRHAFRRGRAKRFRENRAFRLPHPKARHNARERSAENPVLDGMGNPHLVVGRFYPCFRVASQAIAFHRQEKRLVQENRFLCFESRAVRAQGGAETLAIALPAFPSPKAKS